MRIEDLLRDDGPAILDEVAPAVAGLEHYRRDGEDATRRRVEALYRRVVGAVCTRDLDELLGHAGRIAQERFDGGFEFSEVQAAFSMLEEAIQRHALARLPEDELAWGLGLVGTAFLHGKEMLGRTFASRSPRARLSSVDLTSLFRGAGAAGRERFAEELVFPV